jgi:deoxyribose-phosphate aldolase
MAAPPSAVVVVASDHGGYALKTAAARHLRDRGIQVLDVGTHTADACDYPTFARLAAEAVASGRAWRGVIVDGAGIGSCMVANKVRGVRAGMAFDLATAKNAREHNDANVLTLGAGYLDEKTALAIIDTFLSTDCTAERHKRRVGMIDSLDGERPTGSAMKTSLPMLQPAADGEALVRAITQVLNKNPGLVASVLGQPPPNTTGAAMASCPPCTGCGHCVSKRTDDVRAMLAPALPGARVSANLGVPEVPADVAKLIDHTLLRPDATYDEIDKLCDEARKYGFASVCVNSMHVKRCAARLRGATPVVCTVVGFPLGATPREIKALEARRAIRDGAREVDMVIPVGALKSGDHQAVFDDIRTVAEAAREGRAILKVILETALLTDEEKVAACLLARRARADFVKTSTGFAKGGATAHDVALMARAVEHKLGVKASGGVASAADARKMIAAGATRIGASVGVKIAQEARGQATAKTTAAGGAY